jgi:hypothetical protein
VDDRKRVDLDIGRQFAVGVDIGVRMYHAEVGKNTFFSEKPGRGTC